MIVGTALSITDPATLGENHAAYPQYLQAPLANYQVGLICAMIFLLAATNGTPRWWSSAVPSLGLACLLIISRGSKQVLRGALRGPMRLITILLLCLVAITGLSATANLHSVTVQAFLLRSFIPLVIYISVVGATIRPRQHTYVVASLAAGACFVFLRGLNAFVSEWGVPTFEELIWARYNVYRMSGYMNATFGNVGHMGSYIVLVVPTLVLYAFAIAKTQLLRLSAMAIACLGLANLIISGSRTALITIALSFAIIVFSILYRNRLLALYVLVGVVVLLLTPKSIWGIESDVLVDRFFPQWGLPGVDESVLDRIESIDIGWQAFIHNPIFGIGPDFSREVNIYSVAHQSIVHMLSEIGLAGGVGFLIFNMAVISRVIVEAWRDTERPEHKVALLWLIGPSAWLVHGLIGGFTFNLDMAIVWIGMMHIMLALSSATVMKEQ